MPDVKKIKKIKLPNESNIRTLYDIDAIHHAKIEGEISDLTITDGRITLPLATASRSGMSTADGTSLQISSSGVIGIKAVNVNTLFVASGDELVLNCN